MARTKRQSQSVSASLDLPLLRGCSFVWPHTPLIAIGFVILLSGFYFARQSGNDPQAYSNDFNVFYHASREVIAGRDPYQSSLGEWTPYLYPPLLAIALTPLALLPLPIAAYAWFLINAASTIAAAWMSARLACGDAQRLKPGEKDNETGSLRASFLVPLIAAGSLLVVARFALDNFNIGQVNPLIAALVVAHVYFYAKDKKFVSAIVLAIAASIKLTPLILIAYHLAKRRFRFAAGCVALLAAVTTLSFLPLGAHASDAARVFVNRTIRNGQGFDLGDAGNQSLRGAIARQTTGTEPSRGSADAVTLVFSLVLVGAALIAANRASSEITAVSPVVCCLVLVSPLSWKAHFIVLILPIASLISEALQLRTRRRAIAIGAALALTFALFNLTSPKVIGLAAAEWSDAHSFVFVGALLVFVASLTVAMKRKFGNQPRVC